MPLRGSLLAQRGQAGRRERLRTCEELRLGRQPPLQCSSSALCFAAEAPTARGTTSPEASADGSPRDVRRWVLAIAGAAAAVAILGACGGAGSGEEASPSPTEDPFGPPPSLGGNVVEVTPAHGSRIPQSETRGSSLQAPRGVCVRASFRGLPERTLWFRMAVDGMEVTDRLVWYLSTQDAQEGTACYQPPEGLPLGIHDAAVAVQNPFNLNEPPRQLVSWAFEVTP